MNQYHCNPEYIEKDTSSDTKSNSSNTTNHTAIKHSTLRQTASSHSTTITNLRPFQNYYADKSVKEIHRKRSREIAEEFNNKSTKKEQIEASNIPLNCTNTNNRDKCTQNNYKPKEPSYKDYSEINQKNIISLLINKLDKQANLLNVYSTKLDVIQDKSLYQLEYMLADIQKIKSETTDLTGKINYTIDKLNKIEWISDELLNFKNEIQKLKQLVFMQNKYINQLQMNNKNADNVTFTYHTRDNKPLQ